MNRHILVALFTSTLLLACGSTGDDGAADDNAEASAELRANTATKIFVSSTFGSGPTMNERCYVNGHWTVDLGSRRLAGNACIEGESVTVDRTLSTSEVDDVRAHVTAIRTTKRPRACVATLPTNSLGVERGTRTIRYVDARASGCEHGVTPVKEAELAQLVDLLATQTTSK